MTGGGEARGTRPILKRAQIQALRRCPGSVTSSWRGRLLSTLDSDGRSVSGRLHLARIDDRALELHGRLTLFARRSLIWPEDFSAGLVFTSDDGHSYEVVRCNGPSHPHPNRWMPDVPVVPHVHYLTEKDLSRTGGRRRGDGVAIGWCTWRTLEQAVDGLARRIRLPIEVQGEFQLGGGR